MSQTAIFGSEHSPLRLFGVRCCWCRRGWWMAFSCEKERWSIRVHVREHSLPKLSLRAKVSSLFPFGFSIISWTQLLFFSVEFEWFMIRTFQSRKKRLKVGSRTRYLYFQTLDDEWLVWTDGERRSFKVSKTAAVVERQSLENHCRQKVSEFLVSRLDSGWCLIVMSFLASRVCLWSFRPNCSREELQLSLEIELKDFIADSVTTMKRRFLFSFFSLFFGSSFHNIVCPKHRE